MLPAGKAKVSIEPFTEPSPQEIKKESNPFTEADWRMWTYAWSGFLLRLMLVFGASFSVLPISGAARGKARRAHFCLDRIVGTARIHKTRKRLCGKDWCRCMIA
jgi:hypothetical protein